MKILITGGAGYVGSVAARLLLGAGHEVRVVDDLMHGGRALLGLYPFDGFEFQRGNLQNPEVVAKSVAGVDAVVHLAAIVGDPACARDPELTRANNVEASLELLRQAKQHGVKRFVFASTCSNYGKMADPKALVDETSELRPVSLYAETKVEVERALLASEGHGEFIPSVVRFATVYGVSPRMRLDLTVNEFTAELYTKRELVVFGEQFWRPYLHVRDAARALQRVLESPAELVSGRVFNVGDSDENYTKGTLVELICEAVGGELTVKRVHKNEDPRDYRVSFARIQSELGFAVTRRVPDGISEVMDAVAKGVISSFDDPTLRN